jgi:DNA-directed RNA polymerase specialized sigma24 family protein
MSSTTGGSVTLWISQLKGGEEEALAKLHDRYWPFLVGLARKKMRGPQRGASDEEDIAGQAFWAFYQKLQDGEIPRLNNRHDLYALLGIITARKAINQMQHERRIKRGGGHVRGESVFGYLAGNDSNRGGMDREKGKGPTPEEEAILHDCYQHYLGVLSDNLRFIAERHLAGFSNLEISEELDCSKRTVERKMQIILNKWKEQAADSINALTP